MKSLTVGPLLETVAKRQEAGIAGTYSIPETELHHERSDSFLGIGEDGSAEVFVPIWHESELSLLLSEVAKLWGPLKKCELTIPIGTATSYEFANNRRIVDLRPLEPESECPGVILESGQAELWITEQHTLNSQDRTSGCE